MTAWQDEPPQSRRQARQNERGASADAQVGLAPVPQTRDNFEGLSREGWDSRARRAATPPPAHQGGEQPRSRADAAIASGRRAQRPAAPAVLPETAAAETAQDGNVQLGAESFNPESFNPEPSTAEPLNPEPLHYVTQGRPQVPNYDGPSFRGGALTPQPGSELPATEALDVQPLATDAPAYRVRDYSPESRRSAFSSTTPESASAWTPPTSVPGGDLDYQTQQNLPPVTPAPVVSVHAPAPAQAAPVERTLTRRELRAMQARAEQGAEQSPRALVEPPVAVAPQLAPAPVSTPALSEALAEFDALTATQAPTASPVPAAWESPFEAAQADRPAEPVQSEQVQGEQALVEPAQNEVVEAELVEAEIVEPESEPLGINFFEQLSSGVDSEPVTSDSVMSDSVTSDSVTVEPVDEKPAPELLLPPVASREPETWPFAGLGAQDELPAPTSIAGTAEQETAEQSTAEQDKAQQEPAEHEAPSSSAAQSDQEPVVAGWPLFEQSTTDLPVPEALVAPTVAEVFPAVADIPAAAETPASVPPVTTDSGSYIVPTGHWSTQASIDDDTQGHHSALGRNVGVTTSAITANTLVVSSIPTVNDLTLPLGATGEILITGSIDLPRSLGSTGAHPARYDHSDVDALLEAGDREDSHVDSAPVRAIRAVSTHTSTRNVIEAGKPARASRLPLVLAISAAVMAAGVVTLVVMAFATHMFG
jgi:hypothetical protein